MKRSLKKKLRLKEIESLQRKDKISTECERLRTSHPWLSAEACYELVMLSGLDVTQQQRSHIAEHERLHAEFAMKSGTIEKTQVLECIAAFAENREWPTR